MNDLISIIVPCFNSEKYIADTIRSVQAQTYINWEMLITDDCSTDKSREIIGTFINEDKRIKLFVTECNTGHPSIPRNISLKKAHGNYFALLDSDDVWLPNKLEEQLLFIKNNHYSLVSSYVQLINDKGQLLNKIVRIKEKADYYDMLKNYELTAATIFFTKDVADLLYFPNREQEDFIAWLQVMKQGIVAHNIPKIHARYRVVKGSRSRNKIKMFWERWKILRSVEYISFLKSLRYMSVYTIKAICKNYL